MIQIVGLIVYVYCVARLVQVHVELQGPAADKGLRFAHGAVSIVGCIVLSLLALVLLASGAKP